MRTRNDAGFMQSDAKCLRSGTPRDKPFLFVRLIENFDLEGREVDRGIWIVVHGADKGICTNYCFMNVYQK